MKTALLYFCLASFLFLSGCDGSGTQSTDTPQSSNSQGGANQDASRSPDEGDENASNEPTFGDQYPRVLEVSAKPVENNSWQFDVTLSSPYDTSERYADAWRVLDEQDNELGVRNLTHDHALEQPFTRSHVIQLPENITTVFVEGRDKTNGWSGQRFEFKTEIRQAGGPAPAEVLDLSCWKISLPIDTTGKGKATQIEENEIVNGYMLPEYFYVNEAGDGVVFSSPIKGVLTSANTTYTRSELHEMGRRGDTSIPSYGPGKTVNKNNWVLSTAPEEDQLNASGVDGTLDAVLTVDEVTTTGAVWQQGRVIVGQIHANDDEPAKLYYRKFPHHERGSVFLAHEPVGEDDQLYPLIGTHIPDYYTQDGEVVEPEDGIKLGEKWGYQIKVVGNELTVTIRRDGKEDVVQVVDMTDSKYDVGGQYMYFKAGVYNQNKTGEADERATATFYDLKVTHN